jgi:hypothetical protein
MKEATNMSDIANKPTVSNQIPEAESNKIGKPVSKEEWEKLVEARNKIIKRRKQLFTYALDIPQVDWLVEGIVVRDGIDLTPKNQSNFNVRLKEIKGG